MADVGREKCIEKSGLRVKNLEDHLPRVYLVCPKFEYTYNFNVDTVR